LGPVVADVGAHDARAFGREPQRGSAPDAGTGAGDDHGLVLQQHEGLLVLRRGDQAGTATGGVAGSKRYSRSAVARRILYCVGSGRSSTSFRATPMQSGHVVSLWG